MSFRPDCVRTVTNWSRVKKEHKFEKKSFDAIRFKQDMPVASPKLAELLKNVQELDKDDYEKHGRTFKHFIFSDLKQGGTGAKIIASALTAEGFNLAYNERLQLKSDEELLKTRKKNFILLASTAVYGNNLGVRTKKQLLSKFNERPTNVYGDLARLIVMDSGFKEGIDLFDIKYVHIFEPQVSKADQKQVIGRGTRTCGQKGLVFHPTQGWPLNVFVYDVDIPLDVQKQLNISDDKTKDIDTLFKLYMDSKGIDLTLLTFADELEQAAIVGSVDYELNKNIHRFELEDDTQYDIFGGATYKPSLAASMKTVNCATSSCGRVRPTKQMPIVTPLMTIAAFAIGEQLPKFKSKGAYPREYYCGLLKTNSAYCDALREANNDPVEYIKKHADALLAAIKNNEHRKLPISQRSSFLRLVFMVIPRPVMMKKLKSTPKKSPRNTPNKTPKKVQKKKKDTDEDEDDDEDEPQSEIDDDSRKDSDSEDEYEEEIKDKTPEEILKDAERQITPVSPLPVNTPESRTNAFLKVRNYVRQNFTAYTWPKVKLENLCGYGGPELPLTQEQEGGNATMPQIMDLTPTQGFVSDYFTPENPLKGMLFWHSVGTGKTCSAIATASKTFEQQGYMILWVTRTTLKSDIWKNMFEQVCSKSIINKINKGVNIPENYGDRMRLLSKAWSVRPMSYKQFSNLVEGKNALYQELVKINGPKDPLRKTLLIIDEAHKLYGGADLSSIERPNMNKLHAALMKSYQVSGNDSVKLILMTATPMTNDPMELVKLLNLLRHPSEQLPTDYPVFAKQYLSDDGTFTKKGKFAFLNDIAGHISYLNRERDARQFSQPAVRYITAPISYEELEYGESSLDELSKKLESTQEELKDLKQEEKDKKKEVAQQKKALKGLCVGLKKDERQACLEKAKDGSSKIDEAFRDDLQKIQSAMKEILAQKNNYRKEVSAKKKSMKEGLNQLSTLTSKCLKKQKPKDKIKNNASTSN